MLSPTAGHLGHIPEGSTEQSPGSPEIPMKRGWYRYRYSYVYVFMYLDIYMYLGIYMYLDIYVFRYMFI